EDLSVLEEDASLFTAENCNEQIVKKLDRDARTNFLSQFAFNFLNSNLILKNIKKFDPMVFNWLSHDLDMDPMSSEFLKADYNVDALSLFIRAWVLRPESSNRIELDKKIFKYLIHHSQNQTINALLQEPEVKS